MAKKKSVSARANRNRANKGEMGVIRRGEIYPLELFSLLAAGGNERAGLNLLARLGVRPRSPLRGIRVVIGDEYIDALAKLTD